MIVYLYPHGTYAKYEDGQRKWKYMGAPDPDLVAWDAWGRGEAMIERRRRRNEYNSKAGVIARAIEARNRELQQKDEHVIGEYMKQSVRRFWENYGEHLLDLPDDPDISPNRFINRGDDER
jgi:hypothetical protein